jgi:hypothetical protein
MCQELGATGGSIFWQFFVLRPTTLLSKLQFIALDLSKNNKDIYICKINNNIVKVQIHVHKGGPK